jgi:hypothetical protein
MYFDMVDSVILFFFLSSPVFHREVV